MPAQRFSDESQRGTESERDVFETRLAAPKRGQDRFGHDLREGGDGVGVVNVDVALIVDERLVLRGQLPVVKVERIVYSEEFVRWEPYPQLGEKPSLVK